MFALTALSMEKEEEKKHFLELASNIATTCHESYIRTGRYIQ